MPLRHKATSSKIINVTSRPNSVANTLTKKMGRFPSYESIKISMNGVIVHMQTAENDRTAAEDAKGVWRRRAELDSMLCSLGS